MKRTAPIQALVLLAALSAGGGRLIAQTAPAGGPTLRANVERRFDVLPLRDGVVLRPRGGSGAIRSIEIADGPIAIDGQPVTGAELRDKLGAEDAALVLELSYLGGPERRALFSDANGAASPPPAVPERGAPDRAERRRSNARGGGDTVRIGRSVTVGEGEVVDGDVVAVGGSVSVDGTVNGDVVSVGGGITLGPHASVANNVVVVGGALSRDPGARIGGRVQEVGIGPINFSNWRWSNAPLSLWRASMVGSVFALVGTLTRLAILCLLAALVLLIGQHYAERAGDRALSEPLKSGAIGFLAQLLFLPVLVITIVVLVLTIVGIPLLLLIPFVLLGLSLVGLVGFTGVAHRIGATVAAKFGWATDNVYTATMLGIVVVLLPAVLARVVGLIGVVGLPMTFGLGLIGGIVEYVVWTIGFGAVALMRFGQKAAAAPTS